MSSLQSIMNVDEDQHDASPSTDKKDKDPATPASGFRSQNPSSIPPGHVIRSSQQHSSTQLAEGSEVARSSQQYADEGSSSSSAVQQGKRPAIISDPRDISSAATAPTTFRAEQSRRESNTSVDSMDQHGYGSAASSSSMGGASGGGLPPNHPRRPMGSPNPEVPIRLTPITGRVSRAKKGVPVHTCDMCNPPKVWARFLVTWLPKLTSLTCSSDLHKSRTPQVGLSDRGNNIPWRELLLNHFLAGGIN